MPRDGSGNFSLSDPPFQFDTVADETVMNAVLADIASAITASLAKDGQTTASADIPMGGNKLTNVANAAARNQYAAAGQVQDDSLKVLGSVSGTNTITGTLTPAITAYASGMLIIFEPAGANTGGTTINVNGVGAKSITKYGATALAAGDLASGVPAVIIYDGASFQLLNPQTLAAAAVTNAMLANMAQATIKGRASGAGTGVPADLTAAQLVDIIETADGAGSGIDADTLDGVQGSGYVLASAYTAADVLSKLLTVDGAGSGLDADSVDGVGPVAVGTYSPADSGHSGVVTNVTNASGIYVRVGSVVLVAISCSVAASGSGAGGWDFDLPVASNLAAGSDLSGFVKGSFGDGTATAETTSDLAACNYVSTSSGTHSLVKVLFVYRVI